jgi:L-aspartate oxidase
MTAGAGVVRDAEGLERALRQVRALRRPGSPTQLAEAELANLVTVAEAVLVGALARQESRGGHYRTDFPRTEPAFECRLVQGTAR